MEKKFNAQQLHLPPAFTYNNHIDPEKTALQAQNRLLKQQLRSAAYIIILFKTLFKNGLTRQQVHTHQHIIDRCLQHFEQHYPKNNQFWKWMPFSLHQYSAWVSRKVCKASLLALCRRKHPLQLTIQEIEKIKQYATDNAYHCWSLASIYYQMMIDGALFCSMATFYKYCRLLCITKKKKKHQKNYQPVTSTEPLQKLHLDVTAYRLQNGTKVYLHVLRDNFSKAILGCKAALNCCSKNSLLLLQEVLTQYHLMDREGILITDNGSENKGALKTWMSKPGMLWKHLIAQLDIVQSNSMVEAANKILKHRFLYHRSFEYFEQLATALPPILLAYNNTPLQILHGLTPQKVLNGQIPDKNGFKTAIAAATPKRKEDNKVFDCKSTCKSSP
jgi:putative transposase